MQYVLSFCVRFVLKETKRPSKEMQVTIARQLGLEPQTVGNFFMNARRRSQDKWKDDDGGGGHHVLHPDGDQSADSGTMSSSNNSSAHQQQHGNINNAMHGGAMTFKGSPSSSPAYDDGVDSLHLQTSSTAGHDSSSATAAAAAAAAAAIAAAAAAAHHHHHHHLGHQYHHHGPNSQHPTVGESASGL
jgi:hypothetical protein